MVIFGIFHGLVYLPVLLSWIGPPPYMSAEREHSHSTDVEMSVKAEQYDHGHDNDVMKKEVNISYNLSELLPILMYV